MSSWILRYPCRADLIWKYLNKFEKNNIFSKHSAVMTEGLNFTIFLSCFEQIPSIDKREKKHMTNIDSCLHRMYLLTASLERTWISFLWWTLLTLSLKLANADIVGKVMMFCNDTFLRWNKILEYGLKYWNVFFQHIWTHIKLMSSSIKMA